MAHLEGEIWLTENSTANRLALEQIGLLRAIRETGSITAAAKSIGISYKTAWDRLERLNNLSKVPLVERASGGNRGGGTLLTAQGERLVNGFAALSQQHKDFMQVLNTDLNSLDDIAGFVKHSTLQASARNQFLGTIKLLQTGTVNTDIILELADSLELVAQISEQSRQGMGLQPGQTVLALIKASSVTLAAGESINVSARNCFRGSVSRFEIGAVNTDVAIDIGGGKTLGAMITNPSQIQLGLREGSKVIAFFKASSVILVRV